MAAVSGEPRTTCALIASSCPRRPVHESARTPTGLTLSSRRASRLSGIAAVAGLAFHDLLGEMDDQAFAAVIAKLRKGAEQSQLEQ
jgi:hypothetical protein